MVGDDINHHLHFAGVESLDEILEVVFGAEVLVKLVQVRGPVAMVAQCCVFDNRGDPDCVESHSLDVVQLALNSFECSSAVALEVCARGCGAVCPVESVGDDLVDGF